ncbi:MAG: ATP-binding protein [Thermodesulfobacteriota bacterium]
MSIRSQKKNQEKQNSKKEALRAEREKFRSLLENAPFGLIMIDQNGQFQYINSKFKELLGYDLSDIPDGRTWFRKAYPDPEYRHQVIATWLKDVSDSRVGEKKPRVFRAKCKDGTERVINFITVQLATGEYLITCEDITELKRAEEALRESEEQIRQLQKMEAIGRLAGGIAHDFNNLLTIIKGYSQLSLLELNESHPLKHNLDEILKATERASNLTRQLLAFSRRQILEPKVLNLNLLIQDLNKMLHRILGEDIELFYSLASDLGKVKIDPGQIEQVILNLAINAREAMPSGGKLTIETSNVELSNSSFQKHQEVFPGHYILLAVSDNGTGMTAEILNHIFEPFFTTKEKGTGLGLSTVYGIVKQSGGYIYVYSEPGKGTTFKIYLPRVDEIETSFSPTPGPSSSLNGNETILIVEDESGVRELILRVLKDRGYQVFSASNGEDALRKVREERTRKIDLLVTDVVMPSMSGKQLSDRLKELFPALKTLFISGYTDNAIVHHGILLEGIDLLQKPFSPELLVQKVREVLDH